MGKLATNLNPSLVPASRKQKQQLLQRVDEHFGRLLPGLDRALEGIESGEVDLADLDWEGEMAGFGV